MSTLAALLANSGLATTRDDETRFAPDGARLVYLHAGNLHVATQETRITTIVGSCVAIGMWDQVAGVGGMNHYMLPDDLGGETTRTRYASFAVRQLIEKLHALGASHSRLQARLFGGASVISSLQIARSLGPRNVEVGRRLLGEARIPIVSEEAGGNHGRKVLFTTSNGLSTVKKV